MIRAGMISRPLCFPNASVMPRLHGRHALVLRTQSEAVGPHLHALARPACAVIAAAEKPAGARIDVKDVALRLVHEGAAAFGVGSDLDVRLPGLAAVAAAPAVAAAGRLERHHRAVLRREDSAPAAAAFPELLHGDEDGFSQELLQPRRDGVAAAGVRLGGCACSGASGASSRAAMRVRMRFTGSPSWSRLRDMNLVGMVGVACRGWLARRRAVIDYCRSDTGRTPLPWLDGFTASHGNAAREATHHGWVG